MSTRLPGVHFLKALMGEGSTQAVCELAAADGSNPASWETMLGGSALINRGADVTWGVHGAPSWLGPYGLLTFLEDEGVPAQTAEEVLTVYANSTVAAGAGAASDATAVWIDDVIEQILSEAESVLPDILIGAAA